MSRADQRTYGSVIADERLRPLSRDELERYHRNALVPQVGVVGQQRIRAARILLIGAGGLGAPAALYLAAAGVGAIGLIDDDDVDVSNLQRQVIHTSAAVGRPKVDSAAAAIRNLNPDVGVVTHRLRLTAENALDLLGGWDVIIDGTDNFPTRYLVNDASVMLGLPLVHGAVLGFDGQVGVFDARRGPCYRCLHPTPPPPGSVPSCAEAGVLGVLPGIIGWRRTRPARCAGRTRVSRSCRRRPIPVHSPGLPTLMRSRIHGPPGMTPTGNLRVPRPAPSHLLGFRRPERPRYQGRRPFPPPS